MLKMERYRCEGCQAVHENSEDIYKCAVCGKEICAECGEELGDNLVGSDNCGIEYCKAMRDRVEKAEELLHKALIACESCPNRDGICGKTCSIKDIKEWKEAEGDGRS